MYETGDLRDGVIAALTALTEQGENVRVVVSDSTSTSKIGPYLKRYPDRVVNVGIAEQSLVGVAAGLALGGSIAFTANAAPFLLNRANEQVKNDVCYSETNVKMLGLNAGATYGPLGATHHAIDDISIVSGFGNVRIFAPSDKVEAEHITLHAARTAGPVYIRLDSAALPVVHGADYAFHPGMPDVLRKGEAVLVLTLGSILAEALEACEALTADGIRPTLVSLSSIRPLNEKVLYDLVQAHTAVVTVEEHSLHGGIGAEVAMLLALNGLQKTFVPLGIHKGEFAHYGTRKGIRAHYGIDARGIAQTVKNIM